jgi:hypothetical protein
MPSLPISPWMSPAGNYRLASGLILSRVSDDRKTTINFFGSDRKPGVCQTPTASIGTGGASSRTAAGSGPAPILLRRPGCEHGEEPQRPFVGEHRVDLPRRVDRTLPGAQTAIGFSCGIVTPGEVAAWADTARSVSQAETCTCVTYVTEGVTPTRYASSRTASN